MFYHLYKLILQAKVPDRNIKYQFGNEDCEDSRIAGGCKYSQDSWNLEPPNLLRGMFNFSIHFGTPTIDYLPPRKELGGGAPIVFSTV